MQTVTSADGTAIAYEIHGAGLPLVLVHGDSTRAYWDSVVPQFTDAYTVVMLDRRARGDSGDNPYVYSLEREIEDLRAVVDTLERPPVLFGHSFGALMALEAARQIDVAALIVYEPSILVGDYAKESDLTDQMIDAYEESGAPAAMKLHVAEVLHGGDTDGLDDWLEQWPPWPEYAAFIDTTLRMNREVERYDLPDSIDVGAPAMVLTGTEGPPHLRDSARAVDDVLADSQFLEFDGLSHLGPAADPERVSAAVREFLTTLPTPTA